MALRRRQGDRVIIAVMGATGAGKSSFINLLAGTHFEVSHGLRSCTKGIEVSPPFEVSGRQVTLIDTPGFDDTSMSDTEVLTTIALFLAQTYENGQRLNGIIFLHRISDFRVSGVTRRNFNLFRNLCGDENLSHVVIATSMWGQVDREVGEARELELGTDNMFFMPALDGGAYMMRHDSALESARRITQRLISHGPMTLQIQRELVLEGKDIAETAAGRELGQELAELNKKHKEQLTEIQREMSIALMEKDIQTQQELNRVRDELIEEMQKNAQERVNLASQYAREREEMARQMQALRLSIRAEAAARQTEERAFGQARQSHRVQTAQLLAERERILMQIRNLQRQSQEGRGGGGFSLVTDIILPAATFLARFL
ncbi:P-loop containing nucleoside triphosphate hydrolase protein [Cristinia sonorae]|uniref:P-loop containing nucleoside triphosphate hydrolase protein n=1 Tax=Cristinia sonorae TaxID=1940300 RepID=A0A8K0UCL6_9AGAR|nr:P-loop containing nucleoside triphosphate hydrolase protein [Cristinia sonorae]